MKIQPLFVSVLALSIAGVTGVAMAVAPEGSKDRDHGRTALDGNRDGVIDRSEAAAHPRLAKHFDTLDKNGDGRLEASEQLRGKHHRGRRGHDGMAKVIKLDTNGDGRISKLEAAGHEKLAERFASIDRNRDGYLVRSELRAEQQQRGDQRKARREQRFVEKFVKADSNGDGRLSRAEVESNMARMKDRFAFMDEDRDGYLTRADLQPRR